MQNIDKLVVGQKLPYDIPQGIMNNTVGTLEVRDRDWLEFNCFMPNITPREVNAFRDENITVKYFGNSSNGKNVIYFDTGIGTFECFFNPNLYTDDRMSDFLKCENLMLFSMLVDSKTMTIKAIRYIPVVNRIADKIKSIWKDSMECGITKEEYNDWVDKEIIPVNPAVHFAVAKDIGKLRGGLSPENAVFFGSV